MSESQLPLFKPHKATFTPDGPTQPAHPHIDTLPTLAMINPGVIDELGTELLRFLEMEITEEIDRDILQEMIEISGRTDTNVTVEAADRFFATKPATLPIILNLTFDWAAYAEYLKKEQDGEDN